MNETNIISLQETNEAIVVCRHPDGSLKWADWSTVDRVLQIYRPKAGRHVVVPRMFEQEQLEVTYKLQMFILFKIVPKMNTVPRPIKQKQLRYCKVLYCATPLDIMYRNRRFIK